MNSLEYLTRSWIKFISSIVQYLPTGTTGTVCFSPPWSNINYCQVIILQQDHLISTWCWVHTWYRGNSTHIGHSTVTSSTAWFRYHTWWNIRVHSRFTQIGGNGHWTSLAILSTQSLLYQCPHVSSQLDKPYRSVLNQFQVRSYW